MPRIHLIEGPVGAGKSTFAAQLGRGHHAVCVSLDDWMATLFRPDRPAEGVVDWYLERKERCLRQIWKLAEGIVRAGGDVVLELGLIDRQSRARFYDQVDIAGVDLRLYVLDAPREVRRARVRERNTQRGPTFSMEVPDAFFELASDGWQPVDAIEAEGRDVVFRWTD